MGRERKGREGRERKGRLRDRHYVTVTCPGKWMGGKGKDLEYSPGP